MAKTLRHQRGSIKPLSFYGIKFKLPAVVGHPVEPAGENTRRGERSAPAGVTVPPDGSRGGAARDTGTTRDTGAA